MKHLGSLPVLQAFSLCFVKDLGILGFFAGHDDVRVHGGRNDGLCIHILPLQDDISISR